MEIKYFQIQILNERLKRIYVQGEQNILGIMKYDGKPSTGIPPLQSIKVNSSLKDFYSSSSDMGGRNIISSKIKRLFEEYRQDNVIYLNCPLIKGTEIIHDYWITDVIKFDDQEVDFNLSKFELCEGWVEKEKNGVPIEFGERFSEITFKNFEEMWDLVRNKLNHLSKVKTIKLVMKESCTLPFFFLKGFGIYELIITEELKTKLQNLKLDRGVEFKPLEIPDEDWFGSNGLRKQFYK